MFDRSSASLRLWGAWVGVIAALIAAWVSWRWSRDINVIQPIPDELVAEITFSKPPSLDAIKAAAKASGGIPVLVLPNHGGAKLHAGVNDPDAFCKRLVIELSDAQAKIHWITRRSGQETGHGQAP